MRTRVWSRRAADLPHDLVTGAAADLVGLALGHAAGVERAGAVTDPLVAHALLLLGSIIPKLSSSSNSTWNPGSRATCSP
jgi:hypothetical protein